MQRLFFLDNEICNVLRQGQSGVHVSMCPYTGILPWLGVKHELFFSDKMGNLLYGLSGRINEEEWSHHDDVIKWKHFPRNWPFVRGIHRSPANSPHKGQWRGALMFSLICAWINDWINNREAGDLRRHRDHYYVIVMMVSRPCSSSVMGLVEEAGWASRANMSWYCNMSMNE